MKLLKYIKNPVQTYHSIIYLTQLTYFKIIGHLKVEINNSSFKCNLENFDFWNEVKRKNWENETFAILDKYLDKRKTYLDIGAWIGPTVIYAAKRAKEVYCIEPDYFAYKCLLQNLTLNELYNVIPFNLALSNYNGLRKMGALKRNLGDSTTSLLIEENHPVQISVLSLDWDTWLNLSKIGKIDFIKIDIEGGEFELLPLMVNYLREYKPVLYISFHPPFLKEESREDNMQKVFKILSFYEKCYDSDNKATDISMLAQNKDLSNVFSSFVFI